MKLIETHARAFLAIIILSIGTVCLKENPFLKVVQSKTGHEEKKPTYMKMFSILNSSQTTSDLAKFSVPVGICQNTS